ncbi:MAG: stage III sporulation protein AF [Firmicutes bacterium]|nr:stage III sporulation protein AF [Bacillota bacterium]
MNEITTWVREVFIIILSITFLEILLPEGSMKKYVKFIYSIVIMAVILSPILHTLE